MHAWINQDHMTWCFLCQTLNLCCLNTGSFPFRKHTISCLWFDFNFFTKHMQVTIRFTNNWESPPRRIFVLWWKSLCFSGVLDVLTKILFPVCRGYPIYHDTVLPITKRVWGSVQKLITVRILLRSYRYSFKILLYHIKFTMSTIVGGVIVGRLAAVHMQWFTLAKVSESISMLLLTFVVIVDFMEFALSIMSMINGCITTCFLVFISPTLESNILIPQVF